VSFPDAAQLLATRINRHEMPDSLTRESAIRVFRLAAKGAGNDTDRTACDEAVLILGGR
jgi:hypothetical protein